MEKEREDRQRPKGVSYLPLIFLIAVAFLAATALFYSTSGNSIRWMHYFMGMLFCQFSLLKLFDIAKFADGFQMYDLIAKRFRAYALAYPFIELSLALAFFSMISPIAVYSIAILLLAVGAFGVLKALKNQLDIRCSCMGFSLNVPLSTVTLTEDIAMGLMSLWMLLASL